MLGKASGTGYASLSMFLKSLERAGVNTVHSIDVGIINETARYQSREGEKRTPPTVAQVAMWNEFGARGGRAGGGWGGPTPPRPFMHNSADMNAKDDRIVDELRKGLSQKVPAIDEKVAARIGTFMKGNMVESMKDSRYEPNAALTIELKGSSKPLHDTGLLRESIDFRVNKTKPEGSDDGSMV